jgi:DnaB-like helicase N terminal domain
MPCSPRLANDHEDDKRRHFSALPRVQYGPGSASVPAGPGVGPVMREYAIRAEQALLGAVLLDPAGQQQALDLVVPGDMFRPWHAQVLAAMQRARGRGVLPDPACVYGELRNDPDLPRSVAGNAVPLAGLMEAAPTAGHAPAYAVMVVEGGIRQRLDLEASRLVQASTTGELDAALRQVAQVHRKLDVCQVRWLALPGHLRREPPALGGQVRDAAQARRPVAMAREKMIGPLRPAAEAAGARAVRDLVAAPSQLAQVRAWLQPGHFAHPAHAELYGLMQDMDAAGEPVDAVTVSWEAARRGVVADPGRLVGGTGPFAVASAREVHRHGMLTQAARTGRDIQADAANLACPPGALMHAADDRLRAFETQPQPGPVQVRDAVATAPDRVPLGRQSGEPEREAVS